MVNTDDLRGYSEGPSAYWDKSCSAAADEIDHLRAEVEALRPDAERYRWLREQDWNRSLLACVSDPKQAVKLGHDCPSRGRLDQMVDALRGEEEK